MQKIRKNKKNKIFLSKKCPEYLLDSVDYRFRTLRDILNSYCSQLIEFASVRRLGNQTCCSEHRRSSILLKTSKVLFIVTSMEFLATPSPPLRRTELFKIRTSKFLEILLTLHPPPSPHLLFKS